MITELTEAQEAAMSRYRDEWIAIGLATEKEGFDKQPAENAVKLAYRCAGLSEPDQFIWTESPRHAGICYAILWQSVRQSVEQSVWQSVWQSVGESVWDSVRQSVGESVGESVEQSVGESVWQSVRQSVWQSVWHSVEQSVEQSVRQSVRQSVWRSCYGSHDAYLLAFYMFFHEQCGIDCSKLTGLWECAKHCGWFIPLKDTVIISPRPYEVHTRINERGNHELHADGKPAVYYCDDCKIFAHKGVMLPPDLGSTPVKDWQPERALKEENQEIRRVMLEAIPPEKFESVLNLKVLDTYQSSRSLYELVEARNNPYPSPYKALRFRCPTTGRLYLERVRPDATSAKIEVVESNHGIDPDSFGWEC